MGEHSKCCTKCQQLKPVAEFYRDRRRADGRAPSCKECKRAYEASRRGERAEYHRAYYEANKDRILARTAEYQRSNPDRTREYVRRYNQTEHGRERRRAYAEEYRRGDPERNLRQQQEFRKRHPEKYRMDAHRRRAMLAGVEFDSAVTIESLRERDGDWCCYCSAAMSFDEPNQYAPRRATLEHITPLSSGGSHTFDNAAISCRRCNLSKGSKAPIWAWVGPPIN